MSSLFESRDRIILSLIMNSGCKKHILKQIMENYLKWFILNLLILLSMQTSGQIIVSKNGKGNFRSINEAINSTPSGEDILVHAGDYQEVVNVKEKERSTFLLTVRLV